MTIVGHDVPNSEGPGPPATGSDDPATLVALVYRLVKDPVCTLGALALLCPFGAVAVTAFDPSAAVLDVPIIPVGAGAGVSLLLAQAWIRWLQYRSGKHPDDQR